MNIPAGHDVGLLSPVTVGSRIEAQTGDHAVLQGMLDAEAALARAQARLGAVPPACAALISSVARAENFDVRRIAEQAAETANPVVGLVAALAEAVAREDEEAAHYVHRGSTSQDVLDTGLMLVASRALRTLDEDLARTADALAALAVEHRDVPAAARTLTQHAVPTTFGLKAASWLSGVLDARRRVREVLEHGLPVSVGGAAGTLAGYLEFGAARPAPDSSDYAGALTSAVAAELGLAEPLLPWHTLRAPLAGLGTTLALVAGALGKFAVDVQTLSRTELGEVREPTKPGRGASSAMPHKRNPVLSTRIRTAALQAPNLAATLLACMLAEDERPAGAWHAEWNTLRELLRLTGAAAEAAAELAGGLRVDVDRSRGNLLLHGELLVSERVSAALAPALGRLPARQVVTSLALRASDTGTPLRDLLAQEPMVSAVLSRGEIEELLDPARYTGAAGVLVDRVVEAYWKGLLG